MNQWTQKEFRNLERMHSCGVRVPKPLAYENNILVMEYISVDSNPAPIIRNCTPQNPGEVADWLFKSIRKTFKKAQLVHGDMSEYNILCGNDEYVIIDVSQGVPLKHPMAMELLKRDIENMVRYFKRLGEKRDPTEELYKIME